jgi:hypothetical protein
VLGRGHERKPSLPSRLAAPVTPATGDFSDAKVIRKFGDVPDDLSAL